MIRRFRISNIWAQDLQNEGPEVESYCSFESWNAAGGDFMKPPNRLMHEAFNRQLQTFLEKVQGHLASFCA